MAEKIDITFLGTGSAVPTARRNHPGIVCSFANEMILIDCGEGIQRQFKIAKKNPCKLTRILITHWHGDHTLGLPGLLETLATGEYSKTLHIYGPRGTKKKIALFESIYGSFKINKQIHEVTSGVIVNEKEFKIETKQMNHNTPANAYAISIKDKRRIKKDKLAKLKLPHSPLLGKLQQGKDIVHPVTKKKIKAASVTYVEPGKKIAIVMDTGMNAGAVQIAKGADVFICESTFLSNSDDGEKLAKEYKHLTAKQAATIAKKAKVKKLFLTHTSQRYQKDSKRLLTEAKAVFKNTGMPKDFDVVSF